MGMFSNMADSVKQSFDAWIEKQNNERNPKKNKKVTGTIKTPLPYKKGGGLMGGGQREQLGKLEKE